MVTAIAIMDAGAEGADVAAVQAPVPVQAAAADAAAAPVPIPTAAAVGAAPALVLVPAPTVPGPAGWYSSLIPTILQAIPPAAAGISACTSQLCNSSVKEAGVILKNCTGLKIP